MIKFFRKRKDPLAELKAEIKSIHFENAADVLQLARPAVIIDSKRVKAKLGESKFGGFPDLPLSVDWPMLDNVPFVFLFQLSMMELKNYDCGMKLPDNGLLSFFHYFPTPEGEYGAEYDYYPDKSQYQLIFTKEVDNLESKTPPEGLHPSYHFPEDAMKFIQSYQIPSTPEHAVVENSNLNATDKEKLYAYGDNFMNIFERQIGGFPLPIQQGSDLDCTAAKYPKLEYLGKEFINEAVQFQNLISFSFDHDFESIGTSNCYIGIQEKDLEELNFTESIVVHQAT